MDARVEQLFRDHYPLLCAAAAHVLLDRDSAEDIVQDAFVRVARARTPADLSLPYVRKIVINRALDVARRRSLARKHLRREAPAQVGSDTYTDPDLMEALARLPPRQRACVVLRFLYDLSEAQTAAELDVAVGTVKSQTHKALSAPRESLPEHAEES